jgi:hypothetical protein
MYKHIVLWKLKKQPEEMTHAELAQEVKRSLDELPTHIPEIKQYETAINIGDYNACFYDVSLISSFDYKDDFWAYTKYPIHDKVVHYIQSVTVSEQIVDYEL